MGIFALKINHLAILLPVDAEQESKSLSHLSQLDQPRVEKSFR
jgi:hypothetical protein